MSRESARGIMARIHMALRALDADMDRIEEIAASRLGLDRSAFRCMDILSRGGGMTPGHLAVEAGLTPGAVTALLDRLERVGYVRRRRDSRDRRRVLIEPTPRAMAKVWPVFEELLAESTAGLRQFSAAELRTILRFVEMSRDTIRRTAERVAAAERRGSGRPQRSPARSREPAVPPVRRSKGITGADESSVEQRHPTDASDRGPLTSEA